MSDVSRLNNAPVHGGNLAAAIKQYGGEPADWLDLSTGISPDSWPVEQLLHQAPASCWQQLPDQDLYQQTQQAAAQYYSPLVTADYRNSVLAAGTQALIQQLPGLFIRTIFCRPPQEICIWLLAGSYGEHKYRWQQSGVTVAEKSEQQLRQALQDKNSELPDILLLVNPDNPSGLLWTDAELQQWQQKLAERQGWLIIDAAFSDCGFSNDDSVSVDAEKNLADNQIILTSVGKFFGLAGLRFGACFITPEYAGVLRNQVGPWPVAGLTLWLVQQAFADKTWQGKNRKTIGDIQQQLLAACEHLPVYGSTALFITLKSERAEQWQQLLARQKIWSRCFKQQNLLRLGLPKKEDLPRLQKALKEI